MRYIVILKGTQPAGPPPEGLMDAIMDLGAEATSSGAMLDNGGLAPSASGARVTVAGGDLSVMDGPFAESKEFISYAIYEVRSKEEAVEWASRFMRAPRRPVAGLGGGVRGRQDHGPRGLRPPSDRVGSYAAGLASGTAAVPALTLPTRSGRVDPCHAQPPAATPTATDAADDVQRARRAVEAIWRIESGRLVAGLARVTGDVGVAEDLAQEALVVALEQWPSHGVPPNPAGWLMTTAKRRAMMPTGATRRSPGRCRCSATSSRTSPQSTARSASMPWTTASATTCSARLTSCHPVLSLESRVALTLGASVGLSTDEIARAS